MPRHEPSRSPLTFVSDGIHQLQLRPRRIRQLHPAPARMEMVPNPTNILAHARRIRSYAWTPSDTFRHSTRWLTVNFHHSLHQDQNIQNSPPDTLPSWKDFLALQITRNNCILFLLPDDPGKHALARRIRLPPPRPLHPRRRICQEERRDRPRHLYAPVVRKSRRPNRLGPRRARHAQAVLVH